MASKPLSNDRVNFTRLSCAIIDEMSQILRDLLSKEISPGDVHNAVLKSPRLTSNLNKNQMQLVKDAVRTGYSEFDITLLCALFRHISNVTKPTNGWGKDKMPGPRDITVGDDIERIRVIRNKVYGHRSSTSVSDTDFYHYWSIMEDICRRMEKYIGGPHLYVQKLTNLKACPVDEKLWDVLNEKLDDVCKKMQEMETTPRDPFPVIEGPQQPVKYGGQLTINTKFICANKNSSVAWQKHDGNKLISIDVSAKKYRGSSTNDQNPILVINEVDLDDKADYQLSVTTDCEGKCSTASSNSISIDVRGLPPHVIIEGEQCIPFGGRVILKASVRSEAFILTWEWQKATENATAIIDISNEKYKGSLNAQEYALLIINNADFTDNARYKLVTTNAFGIAKSNNLSLVVEGELPHIKIEQDKNLEYGEKLTCTAVVESKPPPLSAKWQKMNGDVVENIAITNEKYSGSSCDPQNPLLVINNTDASDKASYQVVVKNNVGVGYSNILKLNIIGAPLIVTIRDVFLDGKTVSLTGKMFDSENTSGQPSIQWIKNGHMLKVSDIDKKYSQHFDQSKGNLCLNIYDFKRYDCGNYQCIVTSGVGKTKSEMFYIDRLFALSNESKAILCCLLLQKDYCLLLNEDRVIHLPEQCKAFFGRELELDYHIDKVINGTELREFIEVIDRGKKLCFMSDMKRNNVFKEMTKIKLFIDFFLKNADKKNISEYCRTPGYIVKEGEICCKLNWEQTKEMIDKLELELLMHATMEDTTVHQIVSVRLKIPMEILRLGKKGLQKYVEHLETGKVKVYHACVMIVGCAYAGKSTLLKKLKNVQMPELLDTESTRGVDVHKDVFVIDNDNFKVTSDEIASHFNIKVSADIPGKMYDKDDKGPSKILKRSNTSIEKGALDKKREFQRSQSTRKMQSVDSKTSISGVKKKMSFLRKQTNVAELEDKKDLEENSSRVYMNKPLRPLDSLSILQSLKENDSKTITVLDFAGHVAYYVYHQVYLNQRTVYLYVMDMSKSLDEVVAPEVCGGSDSVFSKWKYSDFSEYWIKQIHSYSSLTAPVILVATHSEGKTEEEIRQYFWNCWRILPQDICSSHLQQHREFTTELQSDKNIDNIKKCITDVVTTQGYWGEYLPSSWAIFESYIKRISASHKIIKTNELWKQNKDLEKAVQFKNESDMIPMLTFFRNTHIILYFDEEILSNYIILDLQWFIDAFKHIITDQCHAKQDLCDSRCFSVWEKFNETGILTSKLLDLVWKDKDYVNYKEIIMLYMERLGMLAKIDQHVWYVPCMNKIPFPEEELKSFTFSPILCFQFEFLPSIVYYGLLASCITDFKWKIPSGTGGKKHIYQTATLFISDKLQRSFILVGMSQNGIEIQILMKDTEIDKTECQKVRKDFEEKLKHILRTFHSNIQPFTVGYRCKATVYCENPITHVLPETELVGSNIVCPECGITRIDDIDVPSIFSFWNENMVIQKDGRHKKKIQEHKAARGSKTAHTKSKRISETPPIVKTEIKRQWRVRVDGTWKQLSSSCMEKLNKAFSEDLQFYILEDEKEGIEYEYNFEEMERKIVGKSGPSSVQQIDVFEDSTNMLSEEEKSDTVPTGHWNVEEKGKWKKLSKSIEEKLNTASIQRLQNIRIFDENDKVEYEYNFEEMIRVVVGRSSRTLEQKFKFLKDE